MKALNASAVVAKPPGTDTPSPESSPIISPREEFLPPTWARSVRRRSCSHRMLLGKAWALKAGTPEYELGEGRTDADRSDYFSNPARRGASAPVWSPHVRDPPDLLCVRRNRHTRRDDRAQPADPVQRRPVRTRPHPLRRQPRQGARGGRRDPAHRRGAG